MRTDRSVELFARAVRVIPGGVNSPVRAFRGVGGNPLFIARAQGPAVWDVDGNRYLDYVGSWGPMILGHAEPSVVDAVKTAAERGSSYGAPTEGEIRIAELLTKRVPSVERVRLVSSGTEATMSAIRVARGFTKRDAIVKFEGCYHGHADFLLSKAGSGVATFGLPDSPGVPSDFTKHTLTLPFNDPAAARALFEKRGAEIACVILEPIVGNMGCVPPEPGFLELLRELTTKHGALLIFDEVMTGFRVHSAGAQALFGITPDLSTFGKIIGGGLPMGAYGGRAEIMELVAPAGPVYQAGTLSGNPCAVAAGLATLEQLGTPGVYKALESAGKKLEEGLVTALADAGRTGVVQRVGSMFTLFFNGGTPVRNFADAKACDHGVFKQFFHGMLERGIYLPPSGYEAAFISLAHKDEDIERTIEAARAVLAAL
ncbi:MAG: glutamate-1-semialdehyde 2,1-aminomutase [Deltaproteobacteria bacterium]|nr:glutamate-1-semialdehyde 2,1-aminomutase [Deltaproteobacteria bacterium]